MLIGLNHTPDLLVRLPLGALHHRRYLCLEEATQYTDDPQEFMIVATPDRTGL